MSRSLYFVASLAIGAILASPLPASALQPPDGITVDVPGSLQKMLTTVGAPASGTSPATGLFAQHVYPFLDTATLNAALMSARTAGNLTDSCLDSGQIARFEALTMSNGDNIPIRKAFSINASKMADYVEAFYQGSKLLSATDPTTTNQLTHAVFDLADSTVNAALHPVTSDHSILGWNDLNVGWNVWAGLATKGAPKICSYDVPNTYDTSNALLTIERAYEIAAATNDAAHMKSYYNAFVGGARYWLTALDVLPHSSGNEFIVSPVDNAYLNSGSDYLVTVGRPVCNGATVCDGPTIAALYKGQKAATLNKLIMGG